MKIIILGLLLIFTAVLHAAEDGAISVEEAKQRLAEREKSSSGELHKQIEDLKGQLAAAVKTIADVQEQNEKLQKKLASQADKIETLTTDLRVAQEKKARLAKIDDAAAAIAKDEPKRAPFTQRYHVGDQKPDEEISLGHGFYAKNVSFVDAAGGMAKVLAEIRNSTSRRYSYTNITIGVYSKNGKLVSQTPLFFNGIEANETKSAMNYLPDIQAEDIAEFRIQWDGDSTDHRRD